MASAYRGLVMVVFIFASLVDVRVKAEYAGTGGLPNEDLPMMQPTGCWKKHTLERPEAIQLPCSVGARRDQVVRIGSLQQSQWALFPGAVVKALSQSEVRIVSGRALISAGPEPVHVSLLGARLTIDRESQVMVDVRQPLRSAFAAEARGEVVVLKGLVVGEGKAKHKLSSAARIEVSAGLGVHIERLVEWSLPIAIKPSEISQILAVVDHSMASGEGLEQLKALALAASEKASGLHASAAARRLASLEETERSAQEQRARVESERRRIQDEMRRRVFGEHGLTSSFE